MKIPSGVKAGLIICILLLSPEEKIIPHIFLIFFFLLFQGMSLKIMKFSRGREPPKLLDIFVALVF